MSPQTNPSALLLYIRSYPCIWPHTPTGEIYIYSYVLWNLKSIGVLLSVWKWGWATTLSSPCTKWSVARRCSILLCKVVIESFKIWKWLAQVNLSKAARQSPDTPQLNQLQLKHQPKNENNSQHGESSILPERGRDKKNPKLCPLLKLLFHFQPSLLIYIKSKWLLIGKAAAAAIAKATHCCKIDKKLKASFKERKIRAGAERKADKHALSQMPHSGCLRWVGAF